MMFLYPHSHAFLAEAATAVSVSLCPTDRDPKAGPGNARVLAGRHAR